MNRNRSVSKAHRTATAGPVVAGCSPVRLQLFPVHTTGLLNTTYPSREGHQSFYPWIPAHLQTRKLHPLACIPLGRGTGVFIHRSLHISGHGNSVHWPISLQGGALEFLSADPCTFPDMETPSIGPYPYREGLWRIYL